MSNELNGWVGSGFIGFTRKRLEELLSVPILTQISKPQIYLRQLQMQKKVDSCCLC